MKANQNTIITAFCALILIMGVSGCGKCSPSKETAGDATPVDTIPVLATRISSCSRLYTYECQLHKVLVYDDPSTVSGKIFNQDFKLNLPLGKRRIAIPVTATAKAYVDMSKITPSDIHRQGDKLEIVLPDPEVTLTSTQIDHKGVKQKVALLRKGFTDEDITHIQQQGRKDIVKGLANTDIIELAKESAARQLIPIVAQMGFKEENVTITFRKDLTGKDIPSLIRYLD